MLHKFSRRLRIYRAINEGHYRGARKRHDMQARRSRTRIKIYRVIRSRAGFTKSCMVYIHTYMHPFARTHNKPRRKGGPISREFPPSHAGGKTFSLTLLSLFPSLPLSCLLLSSLRFLPFPSNIRTYVLWLSSSRSFSTCSSIFFLLSFFGFPLVSFPLRY